MLNKISEIIDEKIEEMMKGYECRCDCVSCVTGYHFDCYYWPQGLCCPFIGEDSKVIQ